ncbi:flagellar basal body P-ring formation chaperone FlgA [Parendozoicomonas haliclonae]|uniref:Flagella basal body P-ring formation protein FlgA n=1 Tax=Parendozoicomonas haliclonae TaxID=1960125 RepID=A0A1X7AGZ2_9GAMM|nr:flagellar basal body P-ring formation chaperone FlgA [Parendozoicomonas haliclonae]SMA39804.1 flagellar basal body P-ring biosynthesis protein FlgA [Parendozoicomonas haliclonae]
MNSKITLLTFTLLSTGLAASQSDATKNTVNQQIETAVKKVLHQQVLKHAQTLGSRDISIALARLPKLKLEPCSHTPSVKEIGSGKITAKLTRRVNCQQPKWSLNIRAEIGIYKPVVSSQVTIPRNTRILKDDLLLKRENLLTLHGRYFTRISDVAGQMSRRQIYSDRVLQPSMVATPDMVNRNSAVDIEAGQKGFRIAVKGMALDSGSLGDQVQVRNLSSGKVITAIVTGKNKVSISSF